MSLKDRRLINNVKLLRYNDLLGPFMFTVVNSKKRPATTYSVSYNMGSCPLTVVYNRINTI